MKKILFLLIILSQNLPGQNLNQLLKKAENFHILGEVDSVLKYSNMSLISAKAENNSLAQTKAKFLMISSTLRSKPDSAVKILDSFAEKFTDANETKYLTFLSANYGQYYRRTGSFEKAIKSHEKAIEFAEKYFAKNEIEYFPRVVASQYNSIAVVNFDRSEYEKSNENALKALKIANQYKIKQIIGASNIILGNIQMHYNQLDLAQKSFIVALSIAKEVKDIYRQGAALANLGIINLKLLESKPVDKIAYQNANKYFGEALVIAKNQNDNTAISTRYSNLANTENVFGNYKKAQFYIFEALKFADLAKSKVLNLQLSTTLARNYLNLDNTKKAIETANYCLKLSKELSNEKELPAVYDILEKASLKENQLTEAIKYQKLQLEAKDSLFSKSTNEKILELQTKYESEKKQSEIDLLTAQNQVNNVKIQQKNTLILSSIFALVSLLTTFYFWSRQRKQQEVQRSAEMKQRLLRAQLNPHFLFNSLNSIQRLYVEGKTETANDFIADFAQMMRDILEKTGRNKIPIYEEMDFIESYLSLEKRRLADKFDFEIIMDEEIRNSDYQIPSFIVQPLAENALMHGILPKNIRGKIEIIVRKINDEKISISVTDNGVGYYSHKIKKEHNSKGMELITNRLGKNGKLIIEELKDENSAIIGTKIVLEINV
jgi:tetratricopeptide (TPR) repeat protein